MIGKIQRVPLREVWKHEAQDLTCWLEENIDVISEQIGITLTNVEREKEAGAFWVDLVAEDENGSMVIIENQLARSDHDHLGKVITYLVAMDAKTAIWITPDPRPEHIRAISWLNESTPASFYLFKLEAVRINDSIPAPLLIRIVGPTPEGRVIGERKMERAEREGEMYRFWSQFLDSSRGKLNLYARVMPGNQTFLNAGSGLGGVVYAFTPMKHAVNIDLYIDRGSGSHDWNLAVFRQLEASREEIERDFGGPLSWLELEGKQACKIRASVDTARGYRDESEWPAIFALMTETMIRFERAFAPKIRALKNPE